MMSAHFFIESQKLEQAVDEFAKQLKVCAKTTRGRHNGPVLLSLGQA